MNNKNNQNDLFKIPIEYNKYNVKITKNIIDDFHLDESNNIYQILFTNKNEEYNEYRINIINLIKNNYSYDISFLIQNQKLISQINEQDIQNYIKNNNFINDFLKSWYLWKRETSFCRKYGFIELKQFDSFNKNTYFMQLYSMYQLGSPIIQLIIPIILLLLPFFFISFLSREKLTIQNYIYMLKKILSKHAISNIFKIFSNDTNTSNKLTATMFFTLYIFSIYQNILSCFKYYNNLKETKHILYETYNFLNITDSNIEYFLNIIKLHNLNTFDNFSLDLYRQKEKLDIYKNGIQYFIHSINPNQKNIQTKDIMYLGNINSFFYNLYYDTDFDNMIQYFIYFNEYIHSLLCLKNNIHNYNFNSSKYLDSNNNSKREPFIKNMSSPYLVFQNNNNTISHNINLNNKIIITGGNATGKTTFLKTTFLNILFSQQFGFGLYDKALIKPYTKLFSYINIPDTNSRDSLFQSEARRCLEIINYIENNNKNNNSNNNSNINIFCVFDELFTGTNIQDAEYAGIKLIKYLSNYNISFVLTTHFNNMVYKIKKYHKDYIKYLQTNKHFSLKSGISNIKIGKQILKDLGLPKSFFL